MEVRAEKALQDTACAECGSLPHSLIAMSLPTAVALNPNPQTASEQQYEAKTRGSLASRTAL